MWGNAEMGARLAANVNAIVTPLLLLVVGPAAKLPLGCAFDVPNMANMTNPETASFSLCTAEYAYCQSDPDCIQCVDNDAFLDCDVFYRDCDGLWDILCCRFGASSTCKYNEVLFEYLDCALYEHTAACPASNLCGDQWCTTFPESDCPAGTVYEQWGRCDDYCEPADAACCEDPTCGNSFDYDGNNTCSSSEGPAPSSTLCSTGTNGCDATVCCQPDETCADYTGSCFSFQGAALDDVTCDGACDMSTCCVDHEPCSAIDASACEHTRWYNQDQICHGACDEPDVEDYCCSTRTCADFTGECTPDETAAADTERCWSSAGCTASTCCLSFDGALGFFGASKFVVFGGAAATSAAVVAGLRLF